MHTPRPHFAESDFRKSSFSNPNANCVEVARSATAIGVRDSKLPHSPTLLFTPTQADAFLHLLRTR